MSSGRERRRSPRVHVGAHHTMHVQLKRRARLIDISATGVLLLADVELPVGERLRVQVGLSAEPFATALVITRTQPRGDHTGAVGLGAQFTEMDDRSRRSLEEFLRKASE